MNYLSHSIRNVFDKFHSLIGFFRVNWNSMFSVRVHWCCIKQHFYWCSSFLEYLSSSHKLDDDFSPMILFLQLKDTFLQLRDEGSWILYIDILVLEFQMFLKGTIRMLTCSNYCRVLPTWQKLLKVLRIFFFFGKLYVHQMNIIA